MPLLPGDEAATLQRAAETLRDGGLVAFPTETVYGLGARADDDAAVSLIFAAKGRPRHHPLIVHVLDEQAAAFFCPAPGEVGQRLMARFWPGPLTLILPRRAGVAGAAAGEQASVALRSPAHPVARALLARAAALGVLGIAAPSANRFGRLSPTCAEHVIQELGEDLLVLDGGPCPLGIESTILECLDDPPALLRPGGVPRAALEEVLGRPLRRHLLGGPRAPGTLPSHYAPQARLRLFSTAELAAALAALSPAQRVAVAVYARHPEVSAGLAASWRMPDDPAAAARELFAVLRALDASGAVEIWVERPPGDPAWEAVDDRLRRAAKA